MPPTTMYRTRAVDAPLTSGDEELLATLVDELSELRGPAAQAALERLAAAHPSLAGQLRELFAAMLVTDAVAEQSTIFHPGGPAAEDRSGRGQPSTVSLGVSPTDSLPPGTTGFLPGVTPLPAGFGDYELLEEIG
ncbi:MAG: hypothetical protein ACKOHG_09300, partial [Planctomycetia bacterium]